MAEYSKNYAVLIHVKSLILVTENMRESKFIDQNAEKWKQYEQGIRENNLSADELERSFIELNDDLAYARTFYKHRSVRVFLNNLLTPVYDRIYNRKEFSWKNIRDFFLIKAPAIHFKARWFILVSFLVVSIGFAIGYFGTRHDYQFAHTVLGSGYVHMTEENIAKGDPLGVYKYENTGEMFFGIATNNLKVGFLYFVMGALFCVGTMYFLLLNGIVLGVFTYMFTSRGLASEYILTVYQHGTLEILGLVIEGGAGIMLGAGLLFPGTLTRMQSIQNAARRSITMFMVCLPIIVLAAFIESYLTRFTEINNTLRALIILLSLCFMLYYFVIYPWLKFRNDKKFDILKDELKPEQQHDLKRGDILTAGELLVHNLRNLQQKFTSRVVFSALCGLAALFLLWLINREFIQTEVEFQLRQWKFKVSETNFESIFDTIGSSFKLIMWNVYACRYIFDSGSFTVLLSIGFLFFTSVFAVLIRSLHFGNSHPKIISALWQSLVLSFIMVGLLNLAGSYWWIILWLAWPVLAHVSGIAYGYLDGNIFKGLSVSLGLCFRQPLRFAGVVLLMALIWFLLMLGIWALITILIFYTQNMHGTSLTSVAIFKFYVWFNYLVWPFIGLFGAKLFAENGLIMYEKQTAATVNQKISEIAFRKEVYGVETE